MAEIKEHVQTRGTRVHDMPEEIKHIPDDFYRQARGRVDPFRLQQCAGAGW